MRRIFAILLICLLPLQAFAGGVMGVKMENMAATMQADMQMTDAAQAPCHKASQPEQAASQDCCGLQGVCKVLCQLTAMLSVSIAPASLFASIQLPAAFAAAFQSADAHVSFKPPLL